MQKFWESGITIISLIVTIIIMIILAGVTIDFAAGDKGILMRTKAAAEMVRGSQVKESVELAIIENMDSDTAEGDTKTRSELITELREQGILKADEVKLLQKQNKITIGGVEIDFEKLKDDKGYASKVTKYTDGTNTAIIPTGFTVSGFEDERNINTGLVIYQGDLSTANWTTGKDALGNDIKKTYNQYVWIPCTESSYSRTKWTVESDNSSESFKDEVTLSSITKLSGYDKGSGLTIEILNAIANQISSEKASVKKYNGFYIGRYEVGEGNVIRQYQVPWTNIRWRDTYSNANRIDVGSSSVSYLCSSYARDTALNFIQNNSEFTTYASTREDGRDGTYINENWIDKSVTYIDEKGKSATKVAKTAQKLPTGVTTAKCNIYDMGGNVSEYTTELNPLTNGDNDATDILRGGNYNANTTPGHRGDIDSLSTRQYFGFRTTLFIK